MVQICPYIIPNFFELVHTFSYFPFYNLFNTSKFALDSNYITPIILDKLAICNIVKMYTLKTYWSRLSQK